MRTNVTRQFRSRERNVHYVVVSFPGTKVHGNETSRYQYIYCYQISTNQLRTKANWSVWDDDEYTVPHCTYAAQNVWTNDMKQPETRRRDVLGQDRDEARDVLVRDETLLHLETVSRPRPHPWHITKTTPGSMLDSGAEGPGFKSQSQRCRVTVLGKLFTPIVPLFTKQHNWQQPSYGLRG